MRQYAIAREQQAIVAELSVDELLIVEGLPGGRQWLFAAGVSFRRMERARIARERELAGGEVAAMCRRDERRVA